MKKFHPFVTLTCAVILLLTISLVHRAMADDISADEARAKVEDRNFLNRYFAQEFGGVGQLIGNDNQAAEIKLDALSKFVETLSPKSESSQSLVNRAKSSLGFYQRQINHAKTPIEDVIKRLNENPDDREILGIYFTKQNMSLQKLVATDTTQADKQLTEAKKFVQSLKEKVTEDATQSILEKGLKSLKQFDEALVRARQLQAMIGKDAAPLGIETWVNGDALSDEDLKGKVVLLDFWAVWCGPCIATFPHLRHLEETYGDDGLVIIGLTRYYNHRWNPKSKRPFRSQTPVEKADEQNMLTEFAKAHELKHRFAIQADNSMSDYYLVKSIPHVVLLDRDGKIQLIKIGSGENNAEEIEDKIKELL